MFWNVKFALFWQNLAWWNPLLKLAWPRLTKWTQKGFSPLPCILYTWPTSLLCSSVGGREEELRRRRRRHSWSQRPQSPVRGRPAYSCTLTSTHIFLQLWVLLETGQAWVDVEWSQLCGSSSNSSSIYSSSSSSSMGTRWPARGPALNVSPTAFITQPLVFFSSIWIQTTESEIFVNGDKYDSKWDRFFHFFGTLMVSHEKWRKDLIVSPTLNRSMFSCNISSILLLSNFLSTNPKKLFWSSIIIVCTRNGTLGWAICSTFPCVCNLWNWAHCALQSHPKQIYVTLLEPWVFLTDSKSTLLESF